jgi:hypothetical protein
LDLLMIFYKIHWRKLPIRVFLFFSFPIFWHYVNSCNRNILFFTFAWNFSPKVFFLKVCYWMTKKQHTYFSFKLQGIMVNMEQSPLLLLLKQLWKCLVLPHRCRVHYHINAYIYHCQYTHTTNNNTNNLGSHNKRLYSKHEIFWTCSHWNWFVIKPTIKLA